MIRSLSLPAVFLLVSLSALDVFSGRFLEFARRPRGAAGKVLLAGKALQRKASHGLDLQPIVKDALQKLHGGGKTDGYLMLVEAGR